MSDPIDLKSPQPLTRREILERGQYDSRAILGGPQVRVTTTEPLPDIEESGYREVLVRETPTDGLPIARRGLFIGAATMIFVGLITFFMPFLNGLLGGLFGGFFAKRWGRAFAAAAVASVVVPGVFAFLYGFDQPDFYYLFYGLGFWGWTALTATGFFLGAASGVYSRPLAERGHLLRRVRAE